MKDFSVVAKKVTRVPIRFNSNFLEKDVENKIKKICHVLIFFSRVCSVLLKVLSLLLLTLLSLCGEKFTDIRTGQRDDGVSLRMRRAREASAGRSIFVFRTGVTSRVRFANKLGVVDSPASH
jgi:hypothetical protein